MSERSEAELGIATHEGPNLSVEVGVEGRWDALALSEILIPYHSFLVQFGHEQWVVHAHVPGRHGESLDDALEAIDEWRLDRSLEDVSCRVEGEPCQIGERRAA
jgi:hypothetical protein